LRPEGNGKTRPKSTAVSLFPSDLPALDPPSSLTKEEVLSRMKSPDVVLVNVLPEKTFDKFHIKGSQSLTLGMNIRAFGILAQRKFQKQTHLITYGVDGESTLGLNAAKILVGHGFRADHYPGGLVDWVKAALPTAGTEKDIASILPLKKKA
jgi:rhodanese-related sulfurtransferase